MLVSESDDPGAVAAVPLDGGPTVVLASALTDPTGIAVDPSRVYFAESENPGALLLVALDGGAAATRWTP